MRRADLRRRAIQPSYVAAEVLEERALLSAAFGSALSIGNDASNSANDVATDQGGNSYNTGYFSGIVDFDQAAAHSGDTDILTARGATDAFVAKYAPDNSLAWVQRMGGDATNVNNAFLTDSGSKIAIDGNGSVYVTGQFMGSADFGSTTLSSAGDRDGFVVKLDAGGTVQWARSWGTTAFDVAGGVGVDSAGNVYALGSQSYPNSVTYDVLKFNSSGNSVWSKSIVARQGANTGDLAVDGPGNVSLAGQFRGTVDFDPSNKTNYVSSGPQPAAFVLKLDTNGKFGWVSPFVGQTVGSTTGYAAAQSVALDGSGNVIVGGYYNYSVDFNPGAGTTTLPTSGRGFITKLNSSGGLVWARALEANDTTFVYGLDVDAAGSIYATGAFFGTVDLDPGSGVDSRTTAGGPDIFVLKLTAAGNFSWAETFGGTGNDVGFGIAVDSSGVVHLAGAYGNTVDFDPDPLAIYNLTTPGTFRNGFRLRLRQV
ncbi:MAG: hypothetical protein EXS05_03795 [Planctomycetaceae bacterium]|nr:hypothetical protein [Planctomycetaceae bacterium]